MGTVPISLVLPALLPLWRVGYQCEDNMITIHSYEQGKRSEACTEYLKAALHPNQVERIILLPIPTTRDKRTVLNTNVCINEVLDEVVSGTVISGYGLEEAFTVGAQRRGGRVIDLERDEEFLGENAQLTAMCTLGILLGSIDRSLKDLTVGVVGYGRIGRRLTNILLYLGAGVRVFTSREGTRVDLSEYGVASAASSVNADLGGLDILINTAPAPIFPPEGIPKGLRIIDLASGDNFHGIEVEKYPSVPARMFPVSAGRAWGRAVERFISDTT